MTAITDKKLRDKLVKEKTLEMKKTIEMIKPNTYEMKNKKNTIPEALITTKEKQIFKEEPMQKMENSVPGRKQEQQETDLLPDFAMHQTGAQYTCVRHKIQTATTVERKDTTHGYANKE